MCALPTPEAPGPPRRRNSPLQWLALAALGVLLLQQLGLLNLGGPGGLMNGGAQQLAIKLGVLAVAITIHEFSHALIATSFGDTLPRRQGRLTLNPLAHLDPIGTFMILFGPIGWGKPVQIDPNRMRHPALGWALSSIAGPVSNLLLSMALVIGLGVLGNQNLVSPPAVDIVSRLITLNVALAVFNLIPLPPLDGFGFVYGLVPDAVRVALLPLHRYGPLILLALILLPSLIPGFPPILNDLVGAGVQTVMQGLTSLYRAI